MPKKTLYLQDTQTLKCRVPSEDIHTSNSRDKDLHTQTWVKTGKKPSKNAVAWKLLCTCAL